MRHHGFSCSALYTVTPEQAQENLLIHNARDESAVVLEDSPSLRREVPRLLARRYPAARLLAQDETGLPLATFPPTCPWTAAQVLDDDFWPEEATPSGPRGEQRR